MPGSVQDVLAFSLDNSPQKRLRWGRITTHSGGSIGLGTLNLTLSLWGFHLPLPKGVLRSRPRSLTISAGRSWLYSTVCLANWSKNHLFAFVCVVCPKNHFCLTMIGNLPVVIIMPPSQWAPSHKQICVEWETLDIPVSPEPCELLMVFGFYWHSLLLQVQQWYHPHICLYCLYCVYLSRYCYDNISTELPTLLHSNDTSKGICWHL